MPLPASGLRGSWQRCPLFEALSCGRDRVRWPVPLAGARTRPTSGRAGRAGRHTRHGRLVRAAPHISAGAQEGPSAGQEARHQERHRRPAPSGLDSTQEWPQNRRAVDTAKMTECQGGHASGEADHPSPNYSWRPSDLSEASGSGRVDGGFSRRILERLEVDVRG